MMPEVEAHTNTTPSCAFVRIHENARRSIALVECPELSQDDRALIKRELKRIPWRGDNLELIGRHKHLPPLVLLREYRQYVPPACTVHFEPTPLNEADPTLQGLADHLRERADASLHEILSRKPKLSLLTKWTLLIAGIVAACFSFDALFDDGVTNRVQSWMSTAESLLIHFGGLYLVYFSFLRRSWYLVPGGVVIRRGKWRSRPPLVVLSPENAFISVHNRHVRLLDRRTGRLYRTYCSQLEIAVLLAVWQSPIPAPDVSKLVDLR